jgi:hypothetical protein
VSKFLSRFSGFFQSKRLPGLALVALALFARLLPGPRTIDDAFITFRYARNLLAGNGFVFNPAEAVLGTTTPLYTLLMAGMGALFGGVQADFSTISLVTNAVADAVTCLLLWEIGKRLKLPRPGFLAGLLWAVAAYSVTFAIGGLETSVYVLLLTGAAWAFLAEKRKLTALFGALALLTRPDALILLGPLVLSRLIQMGLALRRKPQPSPLPTYLLEMVVFLLPVLAWYGYAWLTFGSPFPHSVTAKLVAYRLDENSALIRLIQHYATPFMHHNLVGAAVGVGLGLVFCPFLYALGARLAWKSIGWFSLPLTLYAWLYLVTFAIPNPLIFRWYLTPPLPLYFLFLLAGLEVLLERLLKTQRDGWRPRLALGLLLLLTLIPLLSEWRLKLDHGPARPAPEMAFNKLELLYRQAAELIAPQMDENTLLAAGDVGVLGYYTPARILDTVGLNSPVSTTYYPLPAEDYVINYAIPAELILNEKPDWVVILEVYGRLTLLKNPDFQSAYELVETLPTDMYGSQGMLIFKRR